MQLATRTLLQEFLQLPRYLLPHLTLWCIVLQQCENIICECTRLCITANKQSGHDGEERSSVTNNWSYIGSRFRTSHGLRSLAVSGSKSILCVEGNAEKGEGAVGGESELCTRMVVPSSPSPSRSWRQIFRSHHVRYTPASLRSFAASLRLRERPTPAPTLPNASCMFANTCGCMRVFHTGGTTQIDTSVRVTIALYPQDPPCCESISARKS